MGDAVHAVGHGQGTAVISLGAASTRFYALDESIHAVRTFNGRVGPADEQPAVVVRSPHHPLDPGCGPVGPDIVPICKQFQGFSVEAGDDLFGKCVETPRPATVFDLEGGEEHQGFLDDVGGQLVVLGIERMGHEVGDALPVEVGHHLVDVLAQFNDLTELSLGDVQHHHMDLATVLREIGGYLRTDEHPRKVGDLQGAVDAVVVADGDEIHPPAAGGLVEMIGRGKAFWAVELAHRPVGGLVGVARMDMQIRFIGSHACHL